MFRQNSKVRTWLTIDRATCSNYECPTSDERGDPGHCGAAQSHPAAEVHVVLVVAGVGRPGEVVQTRRQRLIEETISTHTQNVARNAAIWLTKSAMYT